MLPDIDSLALFVRAAELHSLTKAAEASHIGLAAASRRIALLEHRFKTGLFERSPRGVEMTPAGATLLRHAKLLLLQLNHLQADMADHAAGHKGVLRVLANTSAMTEYLPEDLAAFERSNPDVRLVVEERWSTEIIDSLRRGDADLGIVMEGIVEDGLEMTPYRSDRIAVIAPAGHAIASLRDLRFEDVLQQDLIALESGSSMMRLLAEQAAVLETVLRLRVQVRSFEAVCRMVQAGLGIGVLPFLAARGMGESMQLAVRPLAEPWAERRMLVCVRQDRAGHPSLRRLVEHLAAPATGRA